VLDLVVCHGDFLNARHDYVHQNRSVRGFGSYGDILIRDREMYVAPTPFGVVDGVAHHATLILPAAARPPNSFVKVGDITRRESDHLIVSYRFDLRTNELTAESVRNPGAGREHHFAAWRMEGAPVGAVTLRSPRVLAQDTAAAADEDGGQRLGHAEELRIVLQPLQEPTVEGPGVPRRSARGRDR